VVFWGYYIAPNPKKIIQLDASGKQGRYVEAARNLVSLFFIFKNND
jgi:hypothetical protein